MADEDVDQNIDLNATNRRRWKRWIKGKVQYKLEESADKEEARRHLPLPESFPLPLEANGNKSHVVKIGHETRKEGRKRL